MSFFGIPYYFQDGTTFDAEQLNADLTALLNASNSLQTQVNALSAGGGGGSTNPLPSVYVATATQFGMSTTASGSQNQAALQLAVNTALTNGGGSVFIPAGNYNMSGTVVITGTVPQNGINIYGSSVGGTQLLQQNNSSDTFQINGFSGGNGAGCHFKDLWIQYPDNTSGSGIAIHITGGSQFVDATGCYFNRCPQAFVTDANDGLQCGLRSCIIVQNKYSNPNVGQIDLGCTQGFVDGCLLRQNTGSASGGPSGNIGIRTNGGNSIRITNCQISAFDYGIFIGGGSSQRIFVSNCQIEVVVWGIAIQPNASNKTIYGVYVSECDIKMAQNSTNTSAYGVYIDTNSGTITNVQNINFIGCSVYGWNGSGYVINAAQNVNIVGGLIGSNGQSPATTLLGCGITVGSSSGTPLRIQVVGTDFQGVYSFVGGTQPYALGVFGSSAIRVFSCNMTNQGTGIVFGSSLAANPLIAIYNCTGYNDVGTSVSSSGISSAAGFTVAGLGYYGPASVYLSGSNQGMVVQAGSTSLYGTLANSSVVPFRIPTPTQTYTMTWTAKGTVTIIGE